jgi:hypothetical protein
VGQKILGFGPAIQAPTATGDILRDQARWRFHLAGDSGAGFDFLKQRKRAPITRVISKPEKHGCPRSYLNVMPFSAHGENLQSFPVLCFQSTAPYTGPT